jgi:putative ABC transport system permease protein
VDAEAAEISAHASRGASSGQMLGIYLAEWGLLALPLTAAAVPLGALLARVMGASVGFLRWGAGGLPLPVIWQARDFAYAGAATVLAVAAALVPVAAAARRSIVEARSRASRLPAAPLWQRAYLDVAALALVFVVRALLRGGAAFSGRGLAGPAAIYILPPVFLIAVGLLAVRALGHLLRWLDRRSGPRAAVPVSLALRRVGRLPAQFAPLLVLLCLTAALGAFSAASARTLQRNLAAEVEYVTGADLRLVEASPCTAGNAPLPPVCSALGPAYAANTLPPRALPPFALQMALPGVAAATDVQEVPVTVAAGQQSVQATLVLVDPATFATAAWWGPHLDPLPEASYLALLRTHPDGALLSPDLGGRLPVNAPLGVRVTGFAPGTLSRLGVIPRWPGADVAGPMLVASAAAAPRLAIACPILPTPPPHRPAPAPTHYCPGSRIALMRLLPGARPATMPTDLVPDGIAVSQADLASAQIVAAQRGPQWAGQSGMLSVAFLVALAVAAAGYLLYAWLLLHGQLPQLGLLRAVGIDEAVLVEAVAAEQAILVAAGALAGVLAGLAAAALFVPLYQPEFSGAGGPPFIAAGPGSALAALAGLLLGLLALAVGLLLMLLQRLHVGESVKLEL